MISISFAIIIKWIISFISGIVIGKAVVYAGDQKDYLELFGLVFLFAILIYFMYWS